MATWRNMLACSKLSSLKENRMKGKSRTCITMEKMEKDNRSMSSKCFRLKRGIWNGCQNLEIKLTEPLRWQALMVLIMCHTPRSARAKPGTICPTNVPINIIFLSEITDLQCLHCNLNIMLKYLKEVAKLHVGNPIWLS